MVFCRGCAKEIHETAQTCPSCGAPQGVQTSNNNSRNLVVLVSITLGFSLVFWLLILFVIGGIYGALHPGDISGAHNLGVQWSMPTLIVAVIISGVLAKFGKLPGTKKS